VSGRRQLGAFYTPPDVAAALAAATLGPLIDAGRDPGSIRVCDPAVGPGALLSAAVSFLVARGASVEAATANMTGVDVDPSAVSEARRALGPGANLLVGDALSMAWGAPFDAVVANPPFLGQLKRDTARSRDAAVAAVSRFGAAAAGYADTAALFLMLAADLGDRVGIILPAPLLSTAGSAPARREVGSVTSLVRSWSLPPGTFEAAVHATVLVLRRSSSAPRSWREGRWAAGGAPAVTLRSSGVVGDVATVTADFRDQFYAVARVASDAGPGSPLVTCGLIDPAWLRWGAHPARLGGTVFTRPRADAGQLGDRMEAWAAARLVPKVLLATQSRVLEAIADEDGSLLPVVPVISVACPAHRVWHVLAVLLAPPVAAHARNTHGGAALSADAIKLSARQTASLPLPGDTAAWDAGARLAEAATAAGRRGAVDEWRAAMDHLGAVMCGAYGVLDGGVPEGGVLAWWSAQIDRRAAAIRSSTC